MREGNKLLKNKYFVKILFSLIKRRKHKKESLEACQAYLTGRLDRMIPVKYLQKIFLKQKEKNNEEAENVFRITFVTYQVGKERKGKSNKEKHITNQPYERNGREK